MPVLPTSRREVDAYTDGVMGVAREGPRRLDRGADFSSPYGLDVAYRVPFRSLRLRSRDVDLAGAAGAELHRKLMCPRSPALAADGTVVIGGVVYDVWRVEEEGRRHVVWLSEVATDGTCELLSAETHLDEMRVGRTVETAVEVFVRRAAPSASRQTAHGVDALRPALALRLRACDYAGEARLRRHGVAYAVTGAAGAGPWIDLTCVRREGDRGR